MLQIRDIQVVLETEPEENDEISSSLEPASPDILIDTTNPLTLSEVYKSLPPRHITDRLLALFFSTKYIQMRMYAGRPIEFYADFYSYHS